MYNRCPNEEKSGHDNCLGVLMMNYTIAQTLSPQHFKRRFGIQPQTFKQIINTLTPCWRARARPGAKPKLGLEDRVLVALEYWREYRTYFHIASSWGVSESTLCRIVHWVEDSLMQSRRFRIPGKKQLLKGFGRPAVVVVDVTETHRLNFTNDFQLLIGIWVYKSRTARNR